MARRMVAINLTGPWGYTEKTDPRLKSVTLIKRYAADQLRRADEPNRDFNIALELIGDPGVADLAVKIWNNDPVCQQERQRLLEEHGERAELPTKETVLKEVLALARNKTYTAGEKEKFYKLYSEMSGYTGRNSAAAPSVSVFANKVMYIPSQGSDKSWEDKAKSQQAALVADARADSERNETHH